MGCSHLKCLLGASVADWSETVDRVAATGKIKAGQRDDLVARLQSLGLPGEGDIDLAPFGDRVQHELLKIAPCLYTHVNERCSAAGVVHLIECTLGESVTGANVVRAFDIQHPNRGEPFRVAPRIPCSSAGDVSEALCSAVLTNARIPAMTLSADGWPVWTMPGHILLNQGKMAATKAFGDILIPAAPTNIIISVKTEAARERLLYSANAIEAVGFGFFNEAKEFWTQSRMRLYKRMGFTAIYMPAKTLAEVTAKLEKTKCTAHAVNINGTALYRSLEEFPADMLRVAGKLTLEL